MLVLLNWLVFNAMNSLFFYGSYESVYIIHLVQKNDYNILNIFFLKLSSFISIRFILGPCFILYDYHLPSGKSAF